MFCKIKFCQNFKDLLSQIWKVLILFSELEYESCLSSCDQISLHIAVRRNLLNSQGGGVGGGYSIQGGFLPEVKYLTLLYNSLTEKVPASYTFI